MAAVSLARWSRTAALLGTLACQDAQTGLSPSDHDTVLRFLNCIDCLIPLDSLRALASRKPDATADSLNGALLNGPGLRAITAAVSAFNAGYGRDSAWRLEHGLDRLLRRELYVAQDSAGYIEGYQVNGAMGLGWIRTPRARAYLDSALTKPLPPPVLRAVEYARDSLPSRPP